MFRNQQDDGGCLIITMKHFPYTCKQTLSNNMAGRFGSSTEIDLSNVLKEKNSINTDNSTSLSYYIKSPY